MKKEYKGNSKKGGVYQIRNIQNEKVYIGSAKCFQVRASQHQTQLEKQKHYNSYLQAGFNKDGTNNFIFEVLEVVEGDKLARTTREKEYINQYLEKWENCYNFQKNPITNEASCWSKDPKETKKKLSEQMKKIWEDPEYRENFSSKMKERWQDPEHQKKVSEANSKASKEQWENPKSRERLWMSIKKAAEKRVGKSWGTHTKEHKQKMAKIMEGNSWNKGKKLSKKASETNKSNLLRYKNSHKRIVALKEKLGKPIIAWKEVGKEYVFNTINEAAEFTGLSRSTIRRICHGKQKSRSGWKFNILFKSDLVSINYIFQGLHNKNSKL